MAVLGFNLNKINVEKNKPIEGPVEVSNNVNIKDIIETSLSIGTESQQALRFEFFFSSDYKLSTESQQEVVLVASIKLEGDILYLEEKGKAKEILEDWKNQKRIKKELMSVILNNILSKCNVQALILSQEVNLPSPFPLPKVTLDKPKE